jgi:hypothetical protein
MAPGRCQSWVWAYLASGEQSEEKNSNEMCGRWVRLFISGRCSSDHELFERSSDHRTFSWPLIAMSPGLPGCMASWPVWCGFMRMPCAHVSAQCNGCCCSWFLRARHRRSYVWLGQTVKETDSCSSHQRSRPFGSAMECSSPLPCAAVRLSLSRDAQFARRCSVKLRVE